MGVPFFLLKMLAQVSCLLWPIHCFLRSMFSNGVLGINSRFYNNINNTNTFAIVLQTRPHPSCYLCWLAWSTRNSAGMKSSAFYEYSSRLFNSLKFQYLSGGITSARLHTAIEAFIVKFIIGKTFVTLHNCMGRSFHCCCIFTQLVSGYGRGKFVQSIIKLV